MSDADKAYALAQEKIAEAALKELDELFFDNREFRALDRLPPEISELTKLQTLVLEHVSFSDLASLVGLTGLQFLFLENTPITDLTPLAGLTGLKRLDIDGTPITDLGPISGLKGLQSLRLNNTHITDLGPLAGMTGLQTLILNNTRITNLAPLAGMTGLQSLGLSNNRITDVAPLAGLTKLQTLNLDNTLITDLSPLAEMTELKRLKVSNTQITDLSPIAGLKKLETLQIDQTRVSDLRPVAVAMAQTLGIVHRRIVTFSETAAAAQDAHLAELAQIKGDEERARETLAYLRSLPPWPEPYTPAATPDGSAPKPIGGVPAAPKIKTAQAQIRFLMRNAELTRVTARQFADQIDNALRDVPATNGNELAEPLQTMAEMADTLRHLSEPEQPADTPLERSKVETRIAALETQVRKLTVQLADAEKAREAAEALAKSPGYWQGFRHSAGKASGVAVVSLVTVGAPTAAVYFLGTEHPLVHAFLTVLGRAPKS